MSTVKGNSKKRFAESEKGKRVAVDMAREDTAREFALCEESHNIILNDEHMVDLMFKVYKDDPNLPEIYARHCERKAVILLSWELFRPDVQGFLNRPSFKGEEKEKGMISEHGKKRRSNSIAENESKKKEKGMISEHAKKRRSNRIAENESKKKQDDLPKPGQAPRPVGASLPART